MYAILVAQAEVDYGYAVLWRVLMRNDLLKLKKELEMARKYVPLIWNDASYAFIAHDEEGQTLLEYAATENTSEIVRQCEDFMKEAVVLLSRNNIPYDIIKLTSSAGFLCTPELVELLKNKLEESMRKDEFANFNRVMLNNNISFKYVPVEFSISPYESGVFMRNQDFLDFRFYLDQDCMPNIKEIADIRTLFEKRIFGIVDLEKFRTEIENLDYEFSSWIDGVIKDYGCDYAMALKNGLLDTSLGIKADFRPLELKLKIR